MRNSQQESSGPELRGLRKIRTNYNYGLRELARKAEVDSGQLSRVERGLERPTWRILNRVARALDMPLPALIAAALIEEEADD